MNGLWVNLPGGESFVIQEGQFTHTQSVFACDSTTCSESLLVFPGRFVSFMDGSMTSDAEPQVGFSLFFLRLTGKCRNCPFLRAFY